MIFNLSVFFWISKSVTIFILLDKKFETNFFFVFPSSNHKPNLKLSRLTQTTFQWGLAVELKNDTTFTRKNILYFQNFRHDQIIFSNYYRVVTEKIKHFMMVESLIMGLRFFKVSIHWNSFEPAGNISRLFLSSENSKLFVPVSFFI